MSDIKPSATLHTLRPIPAPSLGLSDAGAELRCRAALRILEVRPEVLRTAEDVAVLAEFIELGYITGEVDE